VVVAAVPPAKPHAAKTHTAKAPPAEASREPGAGFSTATPAEPSPPPKPVCATCGVVASVTPLQQKGEAGAMGTVGGAVAGGVVGHQIGGGHGKDAMTIIGAIGGALAGREVEKRARTTTAYQVRVRMDDGSSRTFTKDQAMPVGQRVLVEGDRLLIDTAPRGNP
jgi:outer membrane lipoprotein SlyB